jgi:cytochrome c oxidase assembly protein Cox11
MNKLDAKFYGEIRKVKDDSVVPDDEYVVFLAKDTAFAQVLPMYRSICQQLGCDVEQLQAVDRMIDRMRMWRAANQERLKIPDAAGEKLLG